MPASLAPTFFKLDFSSIFSVDFVVVMFAFLFVDMFDTLGTLIGCASKANLLDEEGKLPGITLFEFLKSKVGLGLLKPANVAAFGRKLSTIPGLKRRTTSHNTEYLVKQKRP